MIKAVIFDMDGVLIDSEIVYLNHMFQRLKKWYPAVEKDGLYRVVGASSKKTMEIIREETGEENAEAFREMYSRLWDGCQPDYPAIMRKAVPGLLKEIKDRGYLLALASSTSRNGIEAVLTSCGLKNYFDYVVSGEEFRESKPNPEIYLHTAGVLQCTPSQCLVVEDSTYGIMAGHGAGMTVAALIDDRFHFDRTLADYSMYELSEVLTILDQLAAVNQQ